MTKILDWKRAEDPRDVIHLAVQALAEGHLVAFPSDIHYVVVASCLRPSAVDSLGSTIAIANRRAEPPISLLPRSAGEILDYVPNASPVAMRLATRSWPGPLELLIKNGHPGSLTSQLASGTQSKIACPQGYVALSIPRHESLEQVIRLSAGPLLVASASHSAKNQLVVSTDQIHPRIALAIDDGPTATPNQTTIVRVDGNLCRVEREGKLSQADMISLSQYAIVLVCTGNTCRSPMAEALLNKKLQARFPASQGTDGYPSIVTSSAGVAAALGDSASEGAIAAMSKMGLDLRKHQSQPAHLSLMDRADLILTMTLNHRQHLISRWPHLENKTFGLAPDRMEVSDPFGGPVEVYQSCAKKIDQYLDAWLDKLDGNDLAIWSSERN